MTRIRFFDPSREYQELAAEVKPSLNDVLAKGWYILGPEVKRFEESFAHYLGAKHCVSVSSGTDALYLSLLACGVGPGDEVITAPYTFIATATAISWTGAKPVFVDIHPDTYTMDVNKLEQAFTKHTKAIIPVHLYGQCADMDPVLALAKQSKLWVIEDACQAVGATYKNRKAGSMGHLGCFSFYPTKNLGCYGDGGAVVTNDPEKSEHLARLRNHGRRTHSEHDTHGINSRLDEIQAAVLSIKLRHLDQWNERRRQIACHYHTELKGLDQIQTPCEADYGQHTYHLYVIRSADRDHLKRDLASQGIETAIHYAAPLHLQQVYKGLGCRVGAFPASEFAATQVLSLPLYPGLSDAEVRQIIDVLKSAHSHILMKKE